MAHPLVSEYHRARALSVSISAAIWLWYLGELKNQIPAIFGIVITPSPRVPYLLGAALLYELGRVLIEWGQSDKKGRQRLASQLDLGITLLIGLATIILIGKQHNFSIDIDIPWLPTITLVILGLAFGEMLSIFFMNAFLIRPKKLAERLSLPRVPVAIRTSFMSAGIILPPVLLTAMLSPGFGDNLARIWYWILFLPSAIVFIPSCLQLIIETLKTRMDGSKKKAVLAGFKRALEIHDTQYQIGGWDEKIPPSNSRLYLAAQDGDITKVKGFIDSGDDVNERNMHGWTALLIAVANQHIATAEVLLKAGANPDQANLLGRTPLMFSARYGNKELLDLLLKYGASPIQEDNVGPGCLAVAAQLGHLEIVRTLLEAGADPNEKDDDNKTPLEYAEESHNGEIAAMLRMKIKGDKKTETSG